MFVFEADSNSANAKTFHSLRFSSMLQTHVAVNSLIFLHFVTHEITTTSLFAIMRVKNKLTVSSLEVSGSELSNI